mgnify:CR=1 FL=1
MKENFNKGLDIVLGLEGKVTTNDPNDPGGLTIWGLSKRFNPEIYIGMSEAEIRDIYYRKYWVPAGCDIADYPMDICLFDGVVNPQNDPELPFAGNKEIMAQNPRDWKDFLFLRMVRYMKNSKKIYVLGHLQRIIKLYDKLK